MEKRAPLRQLALLKLQGGCKGAARLGKSRSLAELDGACHALSIAVAFSTMTTCQRNSGAGQSSPVSPVPRFIFRITV